LSSEISPLIPETFRLADEQELGSSEAPDVYLAFVDDEEGLIYVTYQQLDSVRAQDARAFWTDKGSDVESLDGACRYTPPSDDSQRQVIVITAENAMGNVGWRPAGATAAGNPPADLGRIAQAAAAFAGQRG